VTSCSLSCFRPGRLVHVQERCWVMRCSALTSWPSEVAKPLLKVHKTTLSIAQEVA
jgi:hypothetical protein